MLKTQNLTIFCSNYRKLTAKWTCIACVRAKSTTEPKTKAYSHTILFPKTNFPARSNNAAKEDIQKVRFIK